MPALWRGHGDAQRPRLLWGFAAPTQAVSHPPSPASWLPTCGGCVRPPVLTKAGLLPASLASSRLSGEQRADGFSRRHPPALGPAAPCSGLTLQTVLGIGGSLLAVAARVCWQIGPFLCLGWSFMSFFLRPVLSSGTACRWPTRCLLV